MTYGTVLSALADPTRRSLYERLRKRPHTVNELVRFAHVSQPAVSQHLRVLRDARLVTHRAEGTRRYYTASHDGLADLRRYVESMWGDALAAFTADDSNPPRKRTR